MIFDVFLIACGAAFGAYMAFIFTAVLESWWEGDFDYDSEREYNGRAERRDGR